HAEPAQAEAAAPEQTEEPSADQAAQPEPTQAEAAAPVEPEQPAKAEASPDAEPSARPVPTPAALARATPRPGPRPHAVPTPAAVAPTATVPVPPALTPAESAEAARWGRVDDDGTVWVREESGERAVGQYPGADAADALAFYVRRYGDLHAKVVLFEARLQATDLSVKEIDQTLKHLTEELAEPAAVGDLGALRARLDALREVAAERRAQAEAERAAAKEAAVAHRTELVEAAEKIAATPPEKM